VVDKHGLVADKLYIKFILHQLKALFINSLNQFSSR